MGVLAPAWHPIDISLRPIGSFGYPVSPAEAKQHYTVNPLAGKLTESTDCIKLPSNKYYYSIIIINF